MRAYPFSRLRVDESSLCPTFFFCSPWEVFHLSSQDDLSARASRSVLRHHLGVTHRELIAHLLNTEPDWLWQKPTLKPLPSESITSRE